MTAAEPGELAVFEGGPWHGWWLTRKRLDDNRAAAADMGYRSTDLAGAVLRYEPTDRQVDNPEGHGVGRAWRWSS